TGDVVDLGPSDPLPGILVHDFPGDRHSRAQVDRRLDSPYVGGEVEFNGIAQIVRGFRRIDLYPIPLLPQGVPSDGDTPLGLGLNNRYWASNPVGHTSPSRRFAGILKHDGAVKACAGL